MKEFGFPGQPIRMFQITMKYSTCSIRVQSSLSAQFVTMNGLTQGDALACLLLNVALEKLIRDSGIQTRRATVYKLVQLLAYSDDLDSISMKAVDL
jgi:sorting nexin-29